MSFCISLSILLVFLAAASLHAAHASAYGQGEPKFRFNPVPCKQFTDVQLNEVQQIYHWKRLTQYFPPQPIIQDNLIFTFPTVVHGKQGNLNISLSSNHADGTGELLEMTSQHKDFMKLLPYTQFKIAFETNAEGKHKYSIFWMSSNVLCQAADVNVPFHWKDIQSIILYQKFAGPAVQNV